MTDKPHYHGHRARLRARFLQAGEKGVADYELLELVLFSGVPRGDLKPVAKALLKKFGGFAEVISAEPERLGEVKGVGVGAIAALKSVQAAAQKLLHGKIEKRPILSSWNSLLDYCKASMGYDKIERLRVLFLDRRNMLVADEIQQKGTVDHTPVYPREVVKRALELGATAIIMVHNHPSGDPTPSRADIDMTQEVVAAGEKLGIVVHDHIIIGKHDHASFKSLGLL